MQIKGLMIISKRYTKGGRNLDEKHTHIILTPDSIFEEFCREVGHAEVPKVWSRVKNWTNMVLDIFGKLGAKYGYEVRREWMLLDETWEIRNQSTSFIAMALEHENTDNIDILLKDELQKLLDVKAILKVLIYYPKFLDCERHIEKIKPKIKSQRLKIPEEHILIVMIHPQFVKRKGFLISGYDFDSEANCSELTSYHFRVNR